MNPVQCLRIRCESEAINHEFNVQLADRMLNLVIADIADEIDKLSYEFAVQSMIQEHCPGNQGVDRLVSCYQGIAYHVMDFLETYE